MEKENFSTLIIKDLGRAYNTSGKSKLKISFIIVKYSLTINTFRAILFYRLINSSTARNFILVNYFLRILNSIVNFQFKVPHRAKIGGGLNIPHHQCIIIGRTCVIGKNATILSGVTIGRSMGKTKGGTVLPTIGDNVLIGAGAVLIGPIKIGDNCIIGANAVVNKDFPENSIIGGVPAKVIGKVDKPFTEIQKKQFNL